MANQVWVQVAGGGGAYFDVDASGNGSGSFQIGEAPGNYTLEATDNFGNIAQASFVVVYGLEPTVGLPGQFGNIKSRSSTKCRLGSHFGSAG